MDDNASTSSIDVQSALSTYVERGWAATPLHWITAEGVCSCNTTTRSCDPKSAGKHPLRKGWTTGPRLSNADLYSIWEEETPLANVGIRTGAISGFWVLDVDPDNGGFQSLQRLQADIGALPTTYVVRTGSGGYHYYFLMPDFPIRNGAAKELQRRYGPGLDIRGDGGQVVAPPSRTTQGAYASQVDAPIVSAPGTLLTLLRAASDIAGPDNTEAIEDLPAVNDLDTNEALRLQTYADHVLNIVTSEYRDAAPGTGNNTLFQSACSAIEIIQAPWNAFTMKDAYQRLRDAAQARRAIHPYGGGQNDGEFSQVWKSARSRTVGQARAVPTTLGNEVTFDPFEGMNVHGPSGDPSPPPDDTPQEVANETPVAATGVHPTTPPPSVTVTEGVSAMSDPDKIVLPMLPEEFYDRRPWLKEIRDIARWRMASPDAVLGSYLALAASQMPAGLRMDTGIATPICSSLYTVMVGPSGRGKTIGLSVAEQIFAKPVKPKGLSTGQGMIEAYWGMIQTQDENFKTTSEKGRISANEFFLLDEGNAFLQGASRAGDITGETLRTMWGGKYTGQHNATKERQRELESGTFVLGMVMGMQLEVAGALLGDATLGTPQRFLFFGVIDPNMEIIDDERPFVDVIVHSVHPDYIMPEPPAFIGGTPYLAINAMDVTLDSDIKRELKEVHLRKGQGYHVNEQDSQKPVMLAKLALIFAYLDGKNHVDRETWEMANQIYDTSAAVRDAAIELAAGQKRAERDLAGMEKGREAVVARRYGDQSKSVLERVVKQLTSSPEKRMTKNALKKAGFASKELKDPVFSEVFEATLRDMETYGRITIESGIRKDSTVIVWCGA